MKNILNNKVVVYFYISNEENKKSNKETEHINRFIGKLKIEKIK